MLYLEVVILFCCMKNREYGFNSISEYYYKKNCQQTTEGVKRTNFYNIFSGFRDKQSFNTHPASNTPWHMTLCWTSLVFTFQPDLQTEATPTPNSKTINHSQDKNVAKSNTWLASLSACRCIYVCQQTYGCKHIHECELVHVTDVSMSTYLPFMVYFPYHLHCFAISSVRLFKTVCAIVCLLFFTWYGHRATLWIV